jgi:hypothetical protein
LPSNARCIGSTGSWLLLDCTGITNKHSYFFHNPFTSFSRFAECVCARPLLMS